MIWSNAQLPDDARARLVAGTRAHKLIVPAAGLVAPTGGGAVDPSLAEADVAFGQPDPAQLLALPRLRWVHLSSAGYNPYDRADVYMELRLQRS